MYRRTLLRLTPAVVTVGLAGCAGDGTDGNGGDEGTPTETDTPSPSPTPTDTPTGSPRPTDPTVEDTTLTILETEGGQERDTADVAVENGAVVVEGTIWGSDGCKTATLEAATYDRDSDTLRVAIATTDREDAGDVCTQVIVEIDYQARVTLSGGLPETVTVTHDGRTVTSTDLE